MGAEFGVDEKKQNKDAMVVVVDVSAVFRLAECGVGYLWPGYGRGLKLRSPADHVGIRYTHKKCDL